MGPSSQPQSRPGQAYRLAWWALGVTSLALLVLQSISWIQGKRPLQNMLNPAGLLLLSCGCLLYRQPLRSTLIGVGVVLMLVAIVLRYLT